MFRHSRTTTRRGNILLVTILLLALFAIVGITMVYYATAQAQRARILSEAANGGGGDFTDDGKQAFNKFIGTIIYDDLDSGTGLANSLRGHSLMATMYGRAAGATVAWNGIGTFVETATAIALDRRVMMNYRYFPGMAAIYDPEYSNPAGRAPNAAVTGTYVPKNAPYTYADINNSNLAVVCPATGEVLVPSFHRQAAFGLLDPSNANWANAQGKYLILRPRPIDHSGFPAVPANADGTYTGDVQNLPGGVGVAHNDSIWIDINAPIIVGPDGKRYKMLVAPLILDLDGRLNVSVHGNRMLQVVPPPAVPDDYVHTSGVGIGPHEVSLERVLGPEGRRIVFARGLAQTRGGQTQRAFASNTSSYPAGQWLPGYAPPAWGGFNANPGPALQFPALTTSQYLGQPNFTNGYDNTNILYIANHPALFNPSEWPNYPGGGMANRAFSLADGKLLSFRHALAPSFYQALEVGGYASPSGLRGTMTNNPTPSAYPIANNTQNSYRLDPDHANRQIFTPYNYVLDRPGLMPMYASQIPGGTALTLVNGQLVNTAAATQPFPAPQAPGAVSDFGTNQWQNVRAALGAIDLNRALADYRANPSLPLSPTNVNPATEQAARLDRQRLARDIFARLVVATGAQATVATTATMTNNAGDVIITATAGTPEFNALRALAQLAANIVDYIDNDDISTPFVWNPVNLLDPQSVANYAPAQLPLSVVFGVEKPRLVLNEAYCEVTNDPNDPAFSDATGKTKAGNPNPAQIRFWLELHNPTKVPYGPTSGPLGMGGAGGTAGSVKVRYTLAQDGAQFSPYQVQIVRSSQGNVSDLLRNPANGNNAANVLGSIGTTPDLTFDFSAGDALPNAAAVYTVKPSVSLANTPFQAGSTLVCAANVPNVLGPEFNPGNFGGFANLIPAGATPAALGGSTSALSYPLPLNLAFPSGATTPAPFLKNHVVLLQRLVNPYLQFNAATNPYMTVDFMDFVPAADRVLLAFNDTKGQIRSARTAAQPGYDPNTPPAMGAPDQPHSIGKVQPYASWTDPAGSYTFPASMVVKQNPNPDAGQGVWHTFTRHNGRVALTPPAGVTYKQAAGGGPATLSGETLMTPFDWLVHLDRPLINQLELLHVTAGKPHELTLQFMAPNGAVATDVIKFAGAAPWLQATPIAYAFATPPLPATNALFRAFELLRVQPYGQQTAFGGRVPGRININTIMDKRVWDALFDAYDDPTLGGTGLGSKGNGFTQAQVDAMWNALMASRTPNMVAKMNAAGAQLTDAAGRSYFTPVPGATIYDMNSAISGGTTYDRPFLPFGAAQLMPGSGFANGGVLGIDDTIFRRPLTAGTTTPSSPFPMIWNLASTYNDTNGVQVAPHPYQQAEAARKILNSTTTVSHTFAVWVTVGYFEVVSDTGTGITGDVKLGKEYYHEVPGDTRHKFFAIVDRTNVGLDPQQFAHNVYTHAQSRPFFTTVEKTNTSINPAQLNISAVSANPVSGTPAVQVYTDGVLVNIYANSYLVVGTGADREIVRVSAISGFTPPGVAGPVTAPTPAFATLTLTTPLTRPHAIGECVSNIVPGNPGPQPNFDVANTMMYGAVVPHWSRLP